jgi:hypothetical protein
MVQCFQVIHVSFFNNLSGGERAFMAFSLPFRIRVLPFFYFTGVGINVNSCFFVPVLLKSGSR